MVRGKGKYVRGESVPRERERDMKNDLTIRRNSDMVFGLKERKRKREKKRLTLFFPTFLPRSLSFYLDQLVDLATRERIIFAF